jgi:DNA helicase II / ATP-dependent DNA helicase PcrA
MQLTQEQTTIISAGNSPQIVRARAGTGKTTTILKACKQGDKIFAFNKKISDEIKEKGFESQTWHAWILGELKRNGLRGRIDVFADTIPAYPLLTNDEDRTAKLKELGKLIPILKENLCSSPEEGHSILESFSYSWNEFPFIWDMYRKSVDNLSSQSPKISFSDLLVLGHKYSDSLKKIPFAWVDECQDTNHIQRAIAKIAFIQSSWVGDPAQAIYSFRGAGMGSFQKIIEDYPNSPINPLSISFRCAKSIIREAQLFVPDILPRPDAPEGSVSSGEIPKILPQDSCVLARTNKELLPILMDSLRSGRMVFFKDKAFLQDLLDYQKKEEKLGAAGIDAWVNKIRDSHSRKMSQIKLDSSRTVPQDILKKGLYNKDQDYPTLSTIHSSKGCEWDKVYLIQWYDSEDLNPREKQEEQNLRYVGITRAKNSLVHVEGEI